MENCSVIRLSFHKLAGALLGSSFLTSLLFIPLNLSPAFEVNARKLPYAYCSKENCSLIQGAQRLFFGPVPESVIRVCKQSNHYALTFDDGPTPNWAPLLKILKEYQVPATFFVNGPGLEKPELQALVKQAYKQGHQLSNHTYHHSNLLELDEKAILREVDLVRDKLLSILPKAARAIQGAKTLRPPFGYANERVAAVLSKAGYQVVRWNSDRYDWELNPSQGTLYWDRFKAHVQFLERMRRIEMNRSIIDLNHDRQAVTLENLPALIRTVRDLGYQFVTLSDCAGEASTHGASSFQSHSVLGRTPPSVF